MLACTDQQTLDKIKKYESEQKFNEHLDTNVAPYIPVDEKFKYLPTNVFQKVKRFLQTALIINPFCKEVNKIFATKVVGKENLKSIKSAVVVCNHVNKLDCMAIRYALKSNKTYFTAAEFNNMQGFLGDMMRAGGLLPMSNNFSAQKNFLKATNKLLNGKNFVIFFPERAEWWGYEKPRPQFDGAYKIAVSNNVPVIPMFITFKNTQESLADPTKPKQFVVNILKPIFINSKLTAKENIKTMKQNCEQQWQNCYYDFYKK